MPSPVEGSKIKLKFYVWRSGGHLPWSYEYGPNDGLSCSEADALAHLRVFAREHGLSSVEVVFDRPPG